jgi:hypothetical protein
MLSTDVEIKFVCDLYVLFLLQVWKMGVSANIQCSFYITFLFNFRTV